MLVKPGRYGHLHNLVGTVPAAPFTPGSLNPVLLLDGHTQATPSLWKNAVVQWPDAFQAQVLSQPVVTSGVVAFDGTNDYMLGGYHISGAKTAQTLPDGAGSDAGKGVTSTGLALDDVTDTFWVANHGQALPGDPYTPSIMNISKDGATKISEILLAPIFPSAQSVQGVSVDTSDSTLWFISRAENLIRHISKTGTDLGSIATDANPNGLAYDGNSDTLLVLYDNQQLKRYNAATAAFVETIATFSHMTSPDHLHLDTMLNVLWMSHGTSGSPGQINAYGINDGILSDAIRLPESTAIEGIYLDGSTLYVADDGYFHSGTFNQLHSYPFDSAGMEAAVTSAYGALEYDLVFQIGGTDPQSKVMFALGNPLSGRGVSVYLVGSTNNTIRVMMNDGVIPVEQVDIVTATPLTTLSVLTIKMNFSTRTISLYQNGVLQGQGSYSASMTTFVRYGHFSIAGAHDGSRVQDMDVRDICVTNYLLDVAQNNDLGQYYAQEHGLSWTDMS